MIAHTHIMAHQYAYASKRHLPVPVRGASVSLVDFGQRMLAERCPHDMDYYWGLVWQLRYAHFYKPF